jgi:hypothetical protein
MTADSTCTIGGRQDNLSKSIAAKDSEMPQTIIDVTACNQTTAEFAKPRKVKPESVLARYNRTGSYYGVVPKKGFNGRLLWPIESNNDHE